VQTRSAEAWRPWPYTACMTCTTTHLHGACICISQHDTAWNMSARHALYSYCEAQRGTAQPSQNAAGETRTYQTARHALVQTPHNAASTAQHGTAVTERRRRPQSHTITEKAKAAHIRSHQSCRPVDRTMAQDGWECGTCHIGASTVREQHRLAKSTIISAEQLTQGPLTHPAQHSKAQAQMRWPRACHSSAVVQAACWRPEPTAQYTHSKTKTQTPPPRRQMHRSVLLPFQARQC
jgi:hypothetical protein